MVLALFTASFDLLLTFRIGGTIRFTQIMLLLLILGALAIVVQDGRILWAKGMTGLSLFVLWQAICIPLVGNYSLAMQFFALLLFTYLGVLAMLQLYGESAYVERLFRAFIWSFLFVGAYGLLQLLGPLLLGVPLPFQAQWLVHGRVPRINAFSYEPSYFATFMLPGYVMMADLWRSQAKIAQSRWMRWGTVLMGALLILSSSKSAWICMALDGLIQLGVRIWKRLKIVRSQLRRGRFLLPLPTRKGLRYGVIGLGATVVLVVGISFLPDPLILLSGTGLAGTAAHSYNDRANRADLTMELIKADPLIGRGLAGVPIAVGRAKGKTVTNMEDVRIYWGFPVLLDTLAASGIIGFLPFLSFLWACTVGAYRVGNRHLDLEEGKWLRALARGMVLEWAILFTDQNLLRVYLWYNFSVILVVRYYLEYGRFRVGNAEGVGGGEPLLNGPQNSEVTLAR